MNLKHNIFFPVSVEGEWHDSHTLNYPCPKLADWLLNTGSLTERLESHTPRFEVQLLGQAECEVKEPEARLVSDGNQALVVRETVLKGDGQPWVFARSLMLPELCDANHQQLHRLGNQPLGKVIFNDRRFQRRDFQVICLQRENNICRSLGLETPHALWGRRSVFEFEHLKLMVAEIFLPGSPAYAELNSKDGRADV